VRALLHIAEATRLRLALDACSKEGIERVAVV
jgi:hypothetical protein